MDGSAATEDGRLSGERAPTDRARILLEINNAIVSHLDLAQVLKSVSTCLKREIKHDFATLALYNPDKHELRLHALDFPNEQSLVKEGQLIPLEGTPASLAFSSRKPVLRHRPDFDEFPAEIMKKVYAIGVRSGCAVPLLCHDKIVGSIALASLRESAFTEDDVDLLMQIATQIAIAVDNAQNYQKAMVAQEQMARERDRSQLLLEINNAVVSNLDLSELLRAISASLHRVIHHDAAFITLFDSNRRPVRVLAFDLKAEGVPVDEATAFRNWLAMEATPEGEAIQTCRPVLVRHQSEVTRFSDSAKRQAEAAGVNSGCAIPLMVQDEPIGALSVVSFRDDAFSAEDVKLLEQSANQIAIAVQNALNFESAREAERQVARERDRSKLLLEINNALVSHLDLRQLVNAISSTLRSVMHQDFVGLVIYEAETRDFAAHALSWGSGVPFEGTQFKPEGTIAGMAFDLDAPVYTPFPDIERFPSPATRRLFDLGLKSMYALPLKVHGRKLGVVAFASARENAWSEAELELFQEVAKQVALASANAISVRDLEAFKDKLAQEKLYLEDEIRNELNFEEIVGHSPALKHVLKLVETVAESDSTVLLLGETGTGKELIARAVHEHSRRKSRTFVKLNCAAIPTGLLESELFGHEKGAFTGAIAQKIGRLELADQGTLFLDEVGDIPVEIQPKLLRALQEREFERLGSTHTKKVNVRLVAATNRNLEKMIEERQFRSDLYYRLNVFPIHIPSLRERPDDIPLLVRYFAEKFSRQMQKRIESIPTETMTRLQQWHWPGNVRELENLVERAVILSTGSVLQVPMPEVKQSAVTVPTAAEPAPPEDGDRESIVKILRETGGMLGGPNGAAVRLGVKRTTLQYKIKKLGITRADWWPTPPSS
ncbi:MAG TPA: sigma 54-interacting transcriptional regulator [Terriglobales bacterium]|nr:sigma 54-interacting transcriptional regulator [Terriglobales bacterium]